MISFKEYLLLNEEKDPQINAIKKICKNDFDIILKAGGTGSGSENNIMKKINAEIEDISNLNVENKAKLITFDYKGASYKLDLVQKRPPKAKTE